jgi:hypothetical protein
LKQSVQFWIRPDAKASKDALLFSRGNLSLKIHNGILMVMIGNEILDFAALGILPEEQWSLVSLNVDEFLSRAMLAIGFKRPLGRTFSTALENQKGTLSIGGADDTASRFNGLVDELTVVHKNLTHVDFKIPAITNITLEGAFTPHSLQTVFLKIHADNASWMRMYQEARISESAWEPYRAFKFLQVVKPQKNLTHVVVLAEFKNPYSDSVKQMRFEIPIPSLEEVQCTLPQDSAILTARP